VQIVEALEALGRKPVPQAWTNTLADPLRRAEACRLQLLAAKAEHTPMLVRVAALDMQKIAPYIKPSELQHVGRLMSAARQTLALLDGQFEDLGRQVRAVPQITNELELQRALEQFDQLLKMAEGVVIAVDTGVRTVTKLGADLDSRLVLDNKFNVPPAPDKAGAFDVVTSR
jgi:hypothetical protein